MTRFEFLNDDLSVRRTVFGEGPGAPSTVVNLGDGTFTIQSTRGGSVAFPPGGLLIESPTFVAFCATSWSGHRYDAPTFFTLRSLDGRALSASAQVRVFHGFGDPNLAWRGQVRVVRREVRLTAASAP